MVPKPRTKAQYIADQAAIFDAGPYRDQPARRAAFLAYAAKVYDAEANNAWTAQFTGGLSALDDGTAKAPPLFPDSGEHRFSFFWLYVWISFAVSTILVLGGVVTNVPQ
jgi:hypothetical protein